MADGKRRSNVFRLAIRHEYVLIAEPEVRLFQLDPLEGDRFSHVGIAIVPKEEDLSNSWPDVEVDGHWSLGIENARTGPITSLPRGFLHPFIDDLRGTYPAGTVVRVRPPSQGNPPRDVVSPPLTLALHPADAAAFDRAFPGEGNSR
ncbi:MAG TPA: hypothetical protein VIM58_08270 [Candidatus Methylacidiphilales bacterium]